LTKSSSVYQVLLFILVLFFPFYPLAICQSVKPVHFKKQSLVPAERNADSLKVLFSSNEVCFNSRAYLFVQFGKYPSADQRQEMENMGIRFLQFIPEKTFFISFPTQQDINLLDKYDLIASFPHEAYLKTTEKVRIAKSSRQSSLLNLRLQYASDVPEKLMISILEDLGAQIKLSALRTRHILDIAIAGDHFDALAKIPAITYIDLIPLPGELLRYRAINNERVNILHHPVLYDLRGAGVTIGIGDAGKVGNHIDLNDHVSNYSDFGAHYHATHVAGIVSGKPNLNPAEGIGVAPEATVITQFFSNIIFQSPNYLNDYGMLITNNSYGSSFNCTIAGDYDLESVFLDDQLVVYDSLFHVFAAGNSGNKTCAPYPSGYATVLDGWQSSKNVLTVGNAKHLDGLSTSSSRGPVDDGRIKPEIVAVGTSVRSTRPNNLYSIGGGTSYSSPAIAGIAALLYERYKQLNGNANPGSTLVKAILCNTAEDLGNPGPDYKFGFGRVNARRAVEILDAGQYFSGSLTDQDSTSYSFSVPSGTAELKVMLMWKDPAGAPYAAPALVNDLDLLVIDPGLQNYKPWILNPSPANVNENAVSGSDHTNPQEQITIPGPIPGSYMVKIKGFDVPLGPQEFYVVYECIPSEITLTYPIGGEQLVPGETEFIRWDDFGTGSILSIEYSSDGGGNWNVIHGFTNSNQRYLAWNVPSNPGVDYLIRVVASEQGDTSQNTFTVLEVPTNLAVSSPCDQYAELTWSPVPNAVGYAVSQLKNGKMEQIAITADTEYLVQDLAPQDTYWFSVATVHPTGKQSRRAAAKAITPDGGNCSWTVDIALDSVLSPKSGRQFTSSMPGFDDSITVRIRNMGTQAIASLPLQYRVNGGLIQNDTLSLSMSGGDTTIFTFSNPFDFSSPGNYLLEIWSSAPSDTLNENDTIRQSIRHVINPVITLPVTEDFESADILTLLSPHFAIPGVEHCDFETSGGTGRLRTYAGQDFPVSGSRAITLDAFHYGTASSNYLVMTFNLSAYDTLVDDVRLNLSFVHHELIQDNNTIDMIWARGTDTAAWIPVYDIYENHAGRGQPVDENGALELSLALKQNSQNFSSSFQLKFGQEGEAAANVPGSEDGYTFDDISIFTVQNDLRLVAVSHPDNVNCGLSSEAVEILIKNTSDSDVHNVDVFYAVNNGTPVNEEIVLIPANSTINYTFSATYNFSQDTSYRLDTWLFLNQDNYHFNDSITEYWVQNYPLIASFPYLEDFENGFNGWSASGENNSWQIGKPAGNIISRAANGTHAWVTNLSGLHNNEEKSFLYSPCFDLSGLTQPVISFAHIYSLEDDYDYNWIEYSEDGTSWTKLGTAGSGTNWYNDATTGQWDDTHEDWHVASIDVPSTGSSVQFRFVLDSDVGLAFEGVGIDDVHMHEKNPVYTGTDISLSPISVSGTSWVHFDHAGQRVFSVHPQDQNLGNMQLFTYFDESGLPRDDGLSYLLERNWVATSQNPVIMPVAVRLYFTDSEIETLMAFDGCPNCSELEDAFSSEAFKYSGMNQDSTILNNMTTGYTHLISDSINIIPYDNGYYAEFEVGGFSEFWLTGPRSVLKDSICVNIKSSNDDAEEHATAGAVNPVSPTIELVHDGTDQFVGLRFQQLSIPRGSFIKSAWLQFVAKETQVDSNIVYIAAESVDNAPAFTTDNYQISSRLRSELSQSWEIPAWNAEESGHPQKSPELRFLVQQVVDRPGWKPGNNIAFILTGSEQKTAYAFDGAPENAASLCVVYDTACYFNHRLYVDPDAKGLKDGRNWIDAFNTFQEALELAGRCEGITEIWIKEGVYPVSFNNNRSSSFMIQGPLKIYGGFNGTETYISQRSTVSNLTILTGDIGILNDSSDNSFHVIEIPSQIDTVWMDGITISGGFADGLGIDENVGGGVFNSGNLVLNNVIFSGCYASEHGGAIFQESSGSFLRIENCQFLSNSIPSILNSTGSVIEFRSNNTIFKE
jgi:hypothetical protein